MDAETQSTDSTELYVKALEWLHQRSKAIIGCAVALVVIAAVIGFMTWKKNSDEKDANTELMNIPLAVFHPVPVSPRALLDIANSHPTTAGGEHARLLGAAALFAEGKYADSYKEFSDFITTYPDSALLPQAKVGVAASLEAQGKLTEAQNKYHDLIIAYPTETSIVAPAKLTLARLYEEGNQPQQALTYYMELARGYAQNQGDPWAAEAQERARLLLAKHPELMKALQDSAQKANPSPSSGFTLGDTGGAPAPAPAPAPTSPSPAAQKPATGTPNQTPSLMTVPSSSTNTAKPK